MSVLLSGAFCLSAHEQSSSATIRMALRRVSPFNSRVNPRSCPTTWHTRSSTRSVDHRTTNDRFVAPTSTCFAPVTGEYVDGGVRALGSRDCRWVACCSSIAAVSKYPALIHLVFEFGEHHGTTIGMQATNNNLLRLPRDLLQLMPL